jgi:hypothetical protein
MRRTDSHPPRFRDFNVYSKQKHVEKLRYIHRNPVRRGLVEKPEDWEWSSYRFYLKGIARPVKLKRMTHGLLGNNSLAKPWGTRNHLRRRGMECAASFLLT